MKKLIEKWLTDLEYPFEWKGESLYVYYHLLQGEIGNQKMTGRRLRIIYLNKDAIFLESDLWGIKPYHIRSKDHLKTLLETT